MRIFISHGTDNSKEEELQFLDALENQLRLPDSAGRSHDILLDRTRLGAGDEWAGVLYDWLAGCHVSILLLSKRALERPWVLKEATILSVRRRLEPGFHLLPVLLPGVDQAAIQANTYFAPLKLDDYQAFESGATPEQVALHVRNRLAGIQSTSATPLERLEQVLVNRIRHADSVALEQACESLLGQAVSWAPDADRSRACARVLARAVVQGTLGKTGSLTALANSLNAAALESEHVTRVLDLAATSWIEEEVASSLRGLIAARHTDRVAAALNSSRIRSGARFAIWRAQLPDLTKDIYLISGANSDNREQEIVSAMCKTYYEKNKSDLDDEEEAAENLENSPNPIFFVIPSPLPDQVLLSNLHARFPSVFFIAHTGDELPSNLPEWIVPLKPGLNAKLEKVWYADYQDAKNTLMR